jgi:hypothetical protein
MRLEGKVAVSPRPSPIAATSAASTLTSALYEAALLTQRQRHAYEGRHVAAHNATKSQADSAGTGHGRGWCKRAGLDKQHPFIPVHHRHVGVAGDHDLRAGSVAERGTHRDSVAPCALAAAPSPHLRRIRKGGVA